MKRKVCGALIACAAILVLSNARGLAVENSDGKSDKVDKADKKDKDKAAHKKDSAKAPPKEEKAGGW